MSKFQTLTTRRKRTNEILASVLQPDYWTLR
jgi:hypothetical protein